ncbi:DUF2752 domain-containing protein [Pleurocapsa sp. PCC 7319]|uniref:DUF2752 domain-containing protein n=1 Tax=Pleurocapsa sp. PCC 7319 TaxID=118161 RepID=UPI0008FBD04D
MSTKTYQLAAICALSTLIFQILYNFNPADPNKIYPPSLSREWGGFYCPGCGMLRALHQLLHGNWQSALRFNPLLIICLPYLIYWITPYFVKYFYRINLYTIHYKNLQIIVTILVILVYGVLRNIPSPIFLWLVPPS